MTPAIQTCSLRAAIAALICAAATGAHARVDVCNGRSTPMTAAVAIAAKDPPGQSTGGHRGATVEGWWKLAPGECATVSDAVASQNWLYFHAHGSGATLQGSARLCVRAHRFTSQQQFLMGGEGCSGDWRQAGFTRRESGATNFRFTIT